MASTMSFSGNKYHSSGKAPKDRARRGIEILRPFVSDIDARAIPKDKEKVLCSRNWSGGFTVNMDHIDFPVLELTDVLDLKNVNVEDLYGSILSTAVITDEDLMFWKPLDHLQGKTKEEIREGLVPNLKFIVDYVRGNEESSSSSEKSGENKLLQRLKYIILELQQNTETDPNAVLMLLAAHANVSGVMKENAITTAYRVLMHQSLEFLKQPLKVQVCRLLADFRNSSVDELAATFFKEECFDERMPLILARFREFMHEAIGIENLLSQQFKKEPVEKWMQQCGWPENWKEIAVEKFYKNHYNIYNIVDVLDRAMHEDPNVLDAQVVYNFMKHNSPLKLSEVFYFLGDVYESNGNMKSRYICWMLQKLDIAHGPKLKFELLDKHLVPGVTTSDVQEDFPLNRQSTCTFDDRIDFEITRDVLVSAKHYLNGRQHSIFSDCMNDELIRAGASLGNIYDTTNGCERPFRPGNQLDMDKFKMQIVDLVGSPPPSFDKLGTA